MDTPPPAAPVVDTERMLELMAAFAAPFQRAVDSAFEVLASLVQPLEDLGAALCPHETRRDQS